MTSLFAVLVCSLPAAGQGNDPPVSFTNQVVPIFAKLGCNTGTCHGRASGQNGFKLSLFGFEPAEDYDYIVTEARGRRISPSAPQHSLLLRKATASVAHGGGKRLEVDSPHYGVLKRWIEQGAPRSRPGEPTVTRLEVTPAERVLPPQTQQQLGVVAHLSDGSTADVTSLTVLESSQPELAEVSPSGLVSVKKLPGTAAIMARYQSLVAVFRATVPLGATVDALPPAKNFVDQLVFQRLKQLGLPPSPLCDDAAFLRRATLDIAGRLPTVKETEAFGADISADKYENLVDRLLASDDYADHFAQKWSAILRNRRKSDKDDAKPTQAFHAWIRATLKENQPYDHLVRGVLTATGEEVKTPAVIWYREVRDAASQLEDVAQLFLGQRLACAKCHHHPFEKWSQQDYYGLAAFFSQVQIKDPPPPKKPKKGDPPPPAEPFQVLHKQGEAKAINPRTGKPVRPTGLGGQPMAIETGADPRGQLVDWMVRTDNAYFARALVNRYWKHFLGRGLVDPEDDLRTTNPASNPELLEALAQRFTESKYDLKTLVRTICKSSVYRLSAEPNQHNADDRQNYSRFLPRRLPAEVLLDAIDDVLQTRTIFKGAPSGTRAVQLPDNAFDSYFLSVFGRPDSASACECERKSDTSLAQVLVLFNSAELLEKIAGKGGKGRAGQLAADKRPHEQKLRELYLTALSRPPDDQEMKALLGHLDKKKGNIAAAYEDILWALLNTKEFLYNH